MTDQQLLALSYVAANDLLYHGGAWGGPPGYRWRGQDGTEAGQAPQWVTDALDLLAARGLIRIDCRRGPLDVGVSPTSSGLAALGADAA